jgi:hypothetical protein
MIGGRPGSTARFSLTALWLTRRQVLLVAAAARLPEELVQVAFARVVAPEEE